jgi:hypothetical protein
MDLAREIALQVGKLDVYSRVASPFSLPIRGNFPHLPLSRWQQHRRRPPFLLNLNAR